MAKNETYGGPFFGPKYFFHKAICITEKIRPYLKSLVKIGVTYDFFHSVAGSCYRYCGVWLMLRDLVLISPFGFNAVKRKFEASLKTRKNGRGELLAG